MRSGCFAECTPLLSAALTKARAMMSSPVSLGLPPAASRNAPVVDALFGLTAQLTAGCLFVIVVVLGFLLWRYRARSGVRATYQRGASRLHTLGVAALAAFTFVVMDVSLARRALADLEARAAHTHDAIRIEVMPAQFSWNVRYAGVDGRFATDDDVVTLDDVHIPIGATVIVALAPRDVIHSFFVPAFRVKQDAIPGRVTHVSFEATQLGAFEIACAQLCGVGHYRMRGVLTVTSRDAYDAWLRAHSEQLAHRPPPEREAQWGWAWAE